MIKLDKTFAENRWLSNTLLYDSVGNIYVGIPTKRWSDQIKD